MKPEDMVRPYTRHPITEMTHERRLKVISNALKEVAEQIARVAEDREFLEDTEGLWTDKFFRSLDRDPEGLFIETVFHFYPARDRQFRLSFDCHSLKCETLVDHTNLKDCTIPVEAEIVLGIPSEEI